MSDDRLTPTDDSSLEKLSSTARARCVKENANRMYIKTYKLSVINCHQVCHQCIDSVLTHTREENDDSRKLLARFKQKLKKGPKMGRKALARFVVLEAVKQGFHGIEKSR
jgi:hypothetical protein